MKYTGTWTRTEYFTIWGEIEADTQEEAEEMAGRGEYKETARKYRGCTYEELDELSPEEVTP